MNVMKYKLLQDVIASIEEFENSVGENETKDFESYKSWIRNDTSYRKITWDGKEKGRSQDSIINTLIVHLNRYAKTYSKSVIHKTKFVSQEDFIYLINLRAVGPMKKSDLIKRNIHEKSPGIQIINRLIANGWVNQIDDKVDKRSKLISLTTEGERILDENMQNIRIATSIVTGNLTEDEKLRLIGLLQKLDDFHLPIYNENKSPGDLLAYANDLLLKE